MVSACGLSSLAESILSRPFWRQFFNRILTSNRILQTNGDIQRKGQGGSTSCSRVMAGDLGGGGTVAP